MKEMEIKNLKSLLPLKKTTTQILISISLFSLVLSWYSSNLLQNQDLHYFSSNSFHLNKNCIFLLCNGILVFVANISTSLRPPSPYDVSEMLQKKIEDSLQLETTTQHEEEEAIISDKYMLLDETNQSNEDDEYNEEDEEEKHQELEHCNNEAMASQEKEDEDGDQNGPQDSWLVVNDDPDDRVEEEEEVDEMEKLSTEELNQRFEEFIRRMKAEFRVNDYEKQQLVMVK